MASASNNKNLGSESGNTFNLSCSFSESSNDTLLADNKTRITVSARLHSNGGSWSSNYTSYLKLYWYDNNKNSSRPEKASASTKALSGGANLDASATFDVVHKADGTLSGYVYATWTRGSSSGGFCPYNGDIGAPADGSGNIYAIALTTIAVKPSYTSISATEITSSSVRLKAAIDTKGKPITSGGWYLSTDGTNYTYNSGNWLDKTITGLKANTKYWYKGTCTTSAGTATSNAATFTTLKPDKPTILSVTTNSIDEDNFNIVINASASLQASISTVYVSIDNGSTWLSNTADILGNNWNISGLQVYTQYNVKVKVKDNFDTESDVTSLVVQTSKHKIMRLITPTGRKMTPVTVYHDGTHKDLDTPDVKVVN